MEAWLILVILSCFAARPSLTAEYDIVSRVSLLEAEVEACKSQTDGLFKVLRWFQNNVHTVVLLEYLGELPIINSAWRFLQTREDVKSRTAQLAKYFAEGEVHDDPLPSGYTERNVGVNWISNLEETQKSLKKSLDASIFNMTSEIIKLYGLSANTSGTVKLIARGLANLQTDLNITKQNLQTQISNVQSTTVTAIKSAQDKIQDVRNTLNLSMQDIAKRLQASVQTEKQATLKYLHESISQFNSQLRTWTKSAETTTMTPVKKGTETANMNVSEQVGNVSKATQNATCPSTLATSDENRLLCFPLLSKCYCVSLFKEPWADAYYTCQVLKMSLLSIESQTENSAIVNAISANVLLPKDYFWTSGRVSFPKGNWNWTSTSMPLTYTNWASGEPNNLGDDECPKEDCAQLVLDEVPGLWNDACCKVPNYFVCESG